jgi:hypothetical protein
MKAAHMISTAGPTQAWHLAPRMTREVQRPDRIWAKSEFMETETYVIETWIEILGQRYFACTQKGPSSSVKALRKERSVGCFG